MAPPRKDPFPASSFRAEEYDPEPGRERVRGWVAILAVATFFAVVTLYLYQASHTSDAAWIRIKDAMQAILPAVTSVLGTVLGFYFGSQKRG